jgi:hypothetical protein
MAKHIHYSLSSGVVKEKMNRFKKTIITSAAVTAAALGFAVPAFAAGGGYCVNSSNGCTQSMSHTQCAGHGAFGAFSGTANDGQQGSAVHGYVLEDKAQGTSLGAETGPANSNLCGNPQN